MPKQLKLFSAEYEPPVTHLSRRRRLTEFKRRFRILTSRCNGDSDWPWLALLVPDNYTEDEARANVEKLVAAEYGEFGKGELSAIRAVCELNNLPQPDAPLHEQVSWKLRQ